MIPQQSLVILLSSSLLLYLVFSLIKFLHKVWWSPFRIQSLMASQGIQGPPYKFMYGNTKAIISMRRESISKPMDHLSHDIFSYVLPHLSSFFNKYGMNFLVWYGPRASLVVSEPELIKEILNDKDQTYPKIDAEAYVKKLIGDGLVTSNGEKWAKMRKLVNYAFHAESLKNMIPAMISSAEVMIERWRNHEGKEIEVYEEFRLFTSEVISRTAFGSSYIEGKNIFDMLRKLKVLMSRNGLKVPLPVISKIYKSRDEIEAEKLEKGIRESVLEIIKKREEKVRTGETKDYGTDFLGVLVTAYHEKDESKKISVEDLIDECKTFYVAGQETTNSLLAWTIMILAIHTDWQNEARKEVLTIFGHEKPSSDGIAKLKMMSMIINETLRLYSPVLGLHRKHSREARLGKLTLPAGIQLHVPILALHHDSNIWGEDAHLFKPERFLEGVAKATNNNITAYIPFGAGPRICVGFNFAITEAKIALSMILQSYSFTLSPAYVHSPCQVLTLCPQHGVQVILHSLKNED
ncbi:cytochrome P450 CYP749A22-like [Tripterygium wilfordii]|uniref:cytochrome P450 CYP749A22-like n=1 Tax=Tripterygium wilfordii TaxID=458696 RepID=UPI0018F85B81|nr:cytochrome P450 CYP749A22-like [Tripterygium wilfordii]